MDIKLIAYDSLGVRSQSTFIATHDINIHIDPAISLAPRRYGLPPHKVEVERLYQLASEIEKYARGAEILIITHYHYDHHDPGKIIPIEIYRNKIVLIKDNQNNINRSQIIRSSRFLKEIKPLAKEILIADSREFIFGKTKIKFSQAVPHGVDTRLGYVIEVSISENDFKLLYTSDVEGLPLQQQLDFIINEKPNIVIIDGPITYLVGYKYDMNYLNLCIENLKKLMDLVKVETIVLDHHLLRDLNYKEKLKDVFQYAESKGVRILTAAEFMGKPIDMLEANRKRLYEQSFEAGKLNIKLEEQ